MSGLLCSAASLPGVLNVPVRPSLCPRWVAGLDKAPVKASLHLNSLFKGNWGAEEQTRECAGDTMWAVTTHGPGQDGAQLRPQRGPWGGGRCVPQPGTSVQHGRGRTLWTLGMAGRGALGRGGVGGGEAAAVAGTLAPIPGRRRVPQHGLPQGCEQGPSRCQLPSRTRSPSGHGGRGWEVAARAADRPGTPDSAPPWKD